MVDWVWSNLAATWHKVVYNMGTQFIKVIPWQTLDLNQTKAGYSCIWNYPLSDCIGGPFPLQGCQSLFDNPGHMDFNL